MKVYLVALVGITAVSNLFAQEVRERFLTGSTDRDGNKTVWSVPDEVIRADPTWDGLTGAPPLSPSKAANIAAAYLNKKHLLRRANFRPMSIRLHRLWALKPHEYHWYYILNLSPETYLLASPPPGEDHFRMVILMDGTIVEPKIKKTQK